MTTTIADIQEIETLIEEWADSYIRTAELPSIIIEKASTANLDNQHLRQLVEKALKARNLSDRQIRRMLPQELKRDYNIVQKNDIVNNSDIMSELPKPIEQPTPQEQEYIDSITTSDTYMVGSNEPISTNISSMHQDLVMSTVKKDWNKVIEILQQEGFTFNTDPQIWKDTGIELSKEFSKEEYATKRYRILIEEILT